MLAKCQGIRSQIKGLLSRASAGTGKPRLSCLDIVWVRKKKAAIIRTKYSNRCHVIFKDLPLKCTSVVINPTGMFSGFKWFSRSGHAETGPGVCRIYRTVWPKFNWSSFARGQAREDLGKFLKATPKRGLQSPGKWRTSLSWSKYPESNGPLRYSGIIVGMCRSKVFFGVVIWGRSCVPKASLFTMSMIFFSIGQVSILLPITKRRPLHNWEGHGEKIFTGIQSRPKKNCQHSNRASRRRVCEIVMQVHI
jgi:hypothetical protein